MARDPFDNPAPLVRRVYSYVAYRVGDGPDAEDVTNDVFERALRYRHSYDPKRGDVLPWLLGIARRCADEHLRQTPQPAASDERERVAAVDVEGEAVSRLALRARIARLDERSRELLALRYGADLTAKQIGAVLGLKTNAVEVALHRALARLRDDLRTDAQGTEPMPMRASSPRALP